MHTDPTLVHTVADRRREALLAEAAAMMRSEPDRLRLKRAPNPIRRLITRFSTVVGWLVAEFEVRPCVGEVSDTTPSLGRATAS